MTVIQAITLISFAVFSIVDLRTRLVPFIDAFFVIAVFFAFPDNKLHVTVLVLVVVWGLFHRIPRAALYHFFFIHCPGPLYLLASEFGNK